MEDNQTHQAQELLSTAAAGEFLHQHLPEKTAEQWSITLTNSRKPGRKVAYRVPFERLGGMGAFYSPEELRRFVEFEKQRSLGTLKLSGRAAEALRAYGIGEKGGSTTGRRLSYSLHPQIDEDTRKRYVQFIVTDPLLVFRVEIEQAKEIRDELSEILACVERWAKK